MFFLCLSLNWIYLSYLAKARDKKGHPAGSWQHYIFLCHSENGPGISRTAEQQGINVIR